ncbi:MAG: glutamate synthase subunit beta [Elusimicrobia bacterium]|nr:glutamate synthase subunit beta [Candidatus Obscuribacterium magneticum]
MGDKRGFLKQSRQNSAHREIAERVKDYKDVTLPRPVKQSQEQASRCMDCSTSFCHWGCPIGNYIPEWNDFVYRGNWKAAFTLLNAANNMPEVTGRVCPALCEYACVLGINDDAVTIRENELSLIEYGFKNGYLQPQSIKHRTGKKAAVIGSGPAGLSCAAQLNCAGHEVTVFEKDHQPGGILRYGIPDFKLEKWILDRRINLWKEEGIVFKTGIEAGKDISSQKLLEDFDAVCLAGGSRVPRDLKIEGRDLKGIVFAMDYLTQSNKRVAGEKISREALIDAKGKKVVVIGGGDTGSDCVGTANRQGAAQIAQIEVLPKPPEQRPNGTPWPRYPMLLKTTSSHEEGAERHWAVMTKRFIGEKGAVKKLSCVKLDFSEKDAKGHPVMKEAAGSEFEIQADLAILAVGFLHPQRAGLLADLHIELDPRGNVKTDGEHRTSVQKVFCAGDMKRGQSLVVWAMSEGRRCAHFMDQYLMGATHLPII